MTTEHLARAERSAYDGRGTEADKSIDLVGLGLVREGPCSYEISEN